MLSEELVTWIQKTVFDINAAQAVSQLCSYTLMALRDTMQLGYFHPK